MWCKKYDECSECHHLIAKGSGQVVEKISHYVYVYSFGEDNSVSIYCDLHKKPYDRVVEGYGYIRYEKKVEPWKRVNEDGTDYKEPKKK